MKKRHQQGQAKKAGRSNSTTNTGATKEQTSGTKDAPDMDVYHDENRRNMFDPEVAESLKIQKKSGG
jgi:hypothetical protein